ncbi:hypothetical protein [Leptospira stimsonii]|nr:hypothetical protein [Leptospira stimsonii]
MNFINDLLLMVRSYFTLRGIQIPEDDNLEKTLLLYLNSISKLVSAKPRNIQPSKEFSDKRSRLNSEDQIAISEILEKIKSGNDFEGHLSQKAFNPEDNDLLLNDWKINHLHISNKKKSASDFFYELANLLLFIFFSPECAYLIDIRPHKERYVFAKKELIKILYSNWPEILEPYRLWGVGPDSLNLNEENRQKFRNLGLNRMITIEDKVYVPIGGGISSNGTNIMDVFEVDRILDQLPLIEKHFQDTNFEEIKNAFKANKIQIPPTIDLRLVGVGDTFVFRELFSGIQIHWNFGP